VATSIRPVAFDDQILPIQGELNQLYAAAQDEYFRRLAGFLHANSGTTTVERRFALECPPGIDHATYGSDPITLGLLELLVKAAGVIRILEIGTFMGVSAMCMAQAAGPGARVVTFEKGSEFAGYARRNVERNGLGDRVRVIQGDVIEQRAQLEDFGRFDLVYLDGGKEMYGKYFPILLESLRSGGTLIADDVLFHGDVLNDSPSTDKGAGVLELCRLVTESGLERVLLPFANGMLLIRKP